MLALAKEAIVKLDEMATPSLWPETTKPARAWEFPQERTVVDDARSAKTTGKERNLWTYLPIRVTLIMGLVLLDSGQTKLEAGDAGTFPASLFSLGLTTTRVVLLDGIVLKQALSSDRKPV